MEFKRILGSARQTAPRVMHGQGEKAHDPSLGFCQEGVMGGQGGMGVPDYSGQTVGSGRRSGRLRGRGHERLGNREMGNERVRSSSKAMMGVGSRGQGTALELPLCGWGRELVPTVSLCGPGKVTCPLRSQVSSAQRLMSSLALRIYEHGELTWGGCQLTRAQSKRNSGALSRNRAHQDKVASTWGYSGLTVKSGRHQELQGHEPE